MKLLVTIGDLCQRTDHDALIEIARRCGFVGEDDVVKTETTLTITFEPTEKDAADPLARLAEEIELFRARHELMPFTIKIADVEETDDNGRRTVMAAE